MLHQAPRFVFIELKAKGHWRKLRCEEARLLRSDWHRQTKQVAVTTAQSTGRHARHEIGVHFVSSRNLVKLKSGKLSSVNFYCYELETQKTAKRDEKKQLDRYVISCCRLAPLSLKLASLFLTKHPSFRSIMKQRRSFWKLTKENTLGSRQAISLFAFYFFTEHRTFESGASVNCWRIS